MYIGLIKLKNNLSNANYIIQYPSIFQAVSGLSKLIETNFHPLLEVLIFEGDERLDLENNLPFISLKVIR